jgi:transposase
MRPKAYLYEVAAYIHNRNPANPPYSRSQIFRAEVQLGLSRKVGSTTSDLAYSPTNLQKRHWYWNHAYPEGVANTLTENIIDIDEAKFKLESQNRKCGKIMHDRRINTRGKYKRVLMGISGSAQNPFAFHQLYSEGGTDLQCFYQFMREFIQWLQTNRPGIAFSFTMDNLNFHKHTIILNLIHNAGYRVIFRAPYWSCDGAIEYAFNTIQTRLQMQYNTIEDSAALENAINNIIGNMDSFRRYFLHVRFPDN